MEQKSPEPLLKRFLGAFAGFFRKTFSGPMHEDHLTREVNRLLKEPDVPSHWSVVLNANADTGTQVNYVVHWMHGEQSAMDKINVLNAIASLENTGWTIALTKLKENIECKYFINSELHGAFEKHVPEKGRLRDNYDVWQAACRALEKINARKSLRENMAPAQKKFILQKNVGG